MIEFSVATSSNPPCVIGDSMIFVRSSAAAKTVWPMVRAFGCFPRLEIGVRKSLFGGTSMIPVPINQKLISNNFLLGSKTINYACTVLTVTNVCDSGWSATGFNTWSLVDALFEPFGNRWDSGNGTSLLFLPPIIWIIGIVVPFLIPQSLVGVWWLRCAVLNIRILV